MNRFFSGKSISIKSNRKRLLETFGNQIHLSLQDIIYVKKKNLFFFSIFLFLLLANTELQAKKGKVWTGNVNSNWENSSNWDGGSLPGNGDDIVIDSVNNFTGAKAHPVIGSNSSFSPGKIDINNGGKLYIQANLTTSDNIKVEGSGCNASFPPQLIMTAGTLTVSGDKNLEAKKGGEIHISGGSIYISGELKMEEGGHFYMEGSSTYVEVNYDNNSKGKLKVKTKGCISTYDQTDGTMIINSGDTPHEIEFDGDGDGSSKYAKINIAGGVFTNNGSTMFKKEVGDSTIFNISGGRVTLVGDVGDEGFLNGNTKEGEININISGGTLIFQGNLEMDQEDLFTQSGSGTIIFQNSRSWTNSGTFLSSGDTVIFEGSTKLFSASGNWQFHHVQISNSNTLSQTGPSNINVSGDWENNGGTFIESTNKVTFNGTSTQMVDASSGESFYDIEINNSGDGTSNIILAANSDITVQHELTLTDGIFDGKTNGSMIKLLDNAISSGGSSSCYVKGKIQKTGNDAFVFLVGDDTVCAKIGISAPSSTADVFTAEYYFKSYSDTTTDGSLNNVSSKEYWILNHINGSSNVKVTLYWEDSLRSGIDASQTDLRVAHFNGTKWVDEGANAVNGGTSGFVTSDTVSSFSPFTFGSLGLSNDPLPIELLSFDASPNGNEVNITWQTATESNNNYFLVEKTKDGKTFEKVANIKGAGNNFESRNYSAIDLHPYEGLSYYRLKQVDYDGSVYYSNLVKINYLKQKPFYVTIQPNPCGGGNFYIGMNGKEGRKTTLKLINPSGETVFSSNFIQHDGKILKPVFLPYSLSPGVYFLVGESNDGFFREKLIID